MIITDIMKNNLNEYDKERLKAIYSPEIVGVPHSNARREMMIMPDGEIREYGTIYKTKKDIGRNVYIASRDCGLSWKEYEAPKGCLGASVYDPKSQRYITIKPVQNEGTFFFSGTDPNDVSPEKIMITDKVLCDVYQPKLSLDGSYWYATSHYSYIEGDKAHYSPVFMKSYDLKEWKAIFLNPTPRHEPVWPDLDIRWENNGAEPVVEQIDGALLMIARTAQNYFWKYYSYDDGETWTDGEQSEFHGTLTTPFILKMNDGRVIFLWNNTQPLPERKHILEWPPVDNDTIIGLAEDVFTNRDAAHCAVSLDGKVWKGKREILLNGIRNDADFRSKGSIENDKSVHQFQALELPFGKILVAAGQNEASRRLLIFDPDWLLEKETSEDFSEGLGGVSLHSYVKSFSAHHKIGHCAWNRICGPLLVPDIECGKEVLSIGYSNDERLLSNRQGMIWNFPSGGSGTVKLEMKIVGDGVRIGLLDRWMNPIDETVRDFAAFYFEVGPECIANKNWFELQIKFDIATSRADAFVNGEKLFGIRLSDPSIEEVSYIHIQSNAKETDSIGTLIRKLEAKIN